MTANGNVGEDLYLVYRFDREIARDVPDAEHVVKMKELFSDREHVSKEMRRLAKLDEGLERDYAVRQVGTPHDVAARRRVEHGKNVWEYIYVVYSLDCDRNPHSLSELEKILEIHGLFNSIENAVMARDAIRATGPYAQVSGARYYAEGRVTTDDRSD